MYSKIGESLQRFKHAITGFINDLSIKTRLIFCFIVFSILLTSSVGIISYTKSSDVINRQSIVYSDTILNQVIDRIEKLKYEVKQISIPLMINPVMQNNNFETLGSIEFNQRKKYIESQFNIDSTAKTS